MRQTRADWLTLYRRDAAITLAAVAAILLMSMTLKGFSTVGNAMALLRGMSVIGIFALGMSVAVIGRGVDFSQIAIALIATGLMVKAMTFGISTLVSIGLGLVTALGLGLLNGVLVAAFDLPPLFATLASSFLYIGLARSTLLPGANIHLPANGAALTALGDRWGLVPVSTIMFGISALCLHLLLTTTIWGRFLYAFGDNPRTAWTVGLPTVPLTYLQYGTSAAFAFLGGLIMLSSTSLVDLQVANSMMIFDVLLVVVLGGVSLAGGRGSIPGVVSATILIGVLLNAMTIMDLGSQAQSILKGAALLTVIILDRGLNPIDVDSRATI